MTHRCFVLFHLKALQNTQFGGGGEEGNNHKTPEINRMWLPEFGRDRASKEGKEAE